MLRTSEALWSDPTGLDIRYTLGYTYIYMLESIEILGTQASHWGPVIPLLGTRDLGNGIAVQNEPSCRASARSSFCEGGKMV